MGGGNSCSHNSITVVAQFSLAALRGCLGSTQEALRFQGSLNVLEGTANELDPGKSRHVNALSCGQKTAGVVVFNAYYGETVKL